MATTEKTPLWLNLRKEYIDDNFDTLKSYLSEYSKDPTSDSFYQTTIALLRTRIEDLLTTISTKPIYGDEDERKSVIFNASLLAVYLLVDGQHDLALPAYIAFMGQLRILNPRFTDSIILAATQRLKYEKISNYGFTWKDIDKIGTELFAYNAAKLVAFDVARKKPLIFSKFGTALITSNGLFLTHESATSSKAIIKNGANSLDTGIGICLRTVSSEKLKQSHEANLPKIEEFINDFITLQGKVQNKKSTPTTLKSYFENDEITVRVCNIDLNNGIIYVETTNPEYQKLCGPIEFKMPSLVYYYTNTLYTYFTVGDYLKATIIDINKPSFSIEKQLVTFFVEDTKSAEVESDEFLAKLIDEKPGYYGWIDEFGIALYTQNTGEFSRGDFAILTGLTYHQGKYYGKIDAKVSRLSNEIFDEKTVRHDCIRAFAEETPVPVFTKPEEEASELSPTILSLLIRQMFAYQKTLLKPSDRFCVLANASVMAEIIGDNLSASYIRFERTYLRALVQFVLGGNMNGIHLASDDNYKDAKSTLIRLSVIELLGEYGRKDDSEKLANAIREFKDKVPILSRLARLIQTSNAMQDTLSRASLNVIKREIIKTLSLETENDADLEADGGIYLGIESGTQEFKTSMIYPSDNNMQPDEYVQNQNVLKGVCAFLNSTTGGVLYLGVNDQGYVVGLENDMKFLKYTLTDSYLRYVQDTIKKYFGVDTLQFIRIEPLYDTHVVAIHIEPHPYRVVELNNTAYLRVNAESREMPENVRQQLIDRKVFTNKEAAAAISLLQHACTQKKCVVLHDYSSSNSGKISDRFVEAYDIKPDDGLIMSYDINEKKICVFKINRIKWVEIKEDHPWTHTDKHKKIEVDVFHMSGEKPIPVSLKLDMLAKNLLVEEFPKASEFIKQHKDNTNVWYFDANVYSLEGVGRFCMGLVDHIDIIESPELKKYIIASTEKAVKKYASI